MNFTPQKVLHLKDELAKKNPKLQGNFLITQKIEGWYVYFEYTLETGWQAPKSSAGREIPAFEHFKGIALPKPSYPCVLIAEAYIPDNIFQVTNGIFNRSVGSYKCDDVVFMMHDIVLGLHKDCSAIRRFNVLLDVAHNIPSSLKKHFQLNNILLASPFHEELWYKTFDRIANAGGEGIVAKRENSLFSFGKRNSDLLKLKLECTVDCLALRLEEGFGAKNNPSLTLISCRPNGIEVRTVISKHEDQALFRANPKAVIGKVVEIKAMEEYSDLQLRQPVFVRVREDKESGDIN
jgi:ATP-dependent DNA ligase